MDIKSKIALVTGATAGIGKACAELLAENGARLILLARREEKLIELSNDLKQKFKTDTYSICADVSEYDQVESTLGNLPEEWRNIDILVNNAGLARGIEKIHEGLLEDWEEMIDTNVKGLLYVSRVVLPQMVEREFGHIINIGSIAGEEVYPGGSVYCGSKYAVKAISQGMVIDTNGKNIRVTNIEPGLVETEFALVRFHWDSEKAKNVYNGMTPLTGRDIAEIMIFALTRPDHVTIQQLLVTPTHQATATIVNRDGKKK